MGKEPFMELTEDIRREIEKNGDKEIILDVVTRLQGDGVVVTRDVVSAIVATLESTHGVVE
jgi:hypothetical protein